MVEQVDRRIDQPVDAQTVADDFAARMDGKLEQSKIDAAVQQIRSTTTAYPAHGSIASMIVYCKVQVVVDDGKTFDGNGGGGMTPGGGALFGHVYTDDIGRLYRDTVSFATQLTPVYTSIEFFDSNHNLLGSFQAGGVSTVTGIAGGTGSWS